MPLGNIAKILQALAIMGVLLVSNPLLAQPSETTPAIPAGALQLLSYEKDELINQGSALLVNKQVVLTSAHLLQGASHLVVQDSQGNKANTTVLKIWQNLDLAALNLDTTSPLQAQPSLFARNSLQQNDTVTVIGFWNKTLEPERSWKLFGPARPKFNASIQRFTSTATGLVKSVSDSAFQHVTSIGRGGYGAPVYNRCQQIAGLNRLPDNFTLDQAWSIHMPAIPVTAVSQSQLLTSLESLGIQPEIAPKPCLSAEEQARKLQMEAESKAKAAKQEAAAEKKKAEAAKKESELNKQQAKAAEEETDATKKQSMETIEDLSSQLQQTHRKNAQEQEKSQTYILIAAAVAVLILIIAVLVWIKRSRDLKVANSRYFDCVLQGHDSARNPLALRISGRDLARSAEGVLIGRNPEGAGVVLGDETVSRNHARLLLDQDRLLLEDLGSANGTRLNGTVLNVGQRYEVQAGDRIELGSAITELKVLTS